MTQRIAFVLPVPFRVLLALLAVASVMSSFAEAQEHDDSLQARFLKEAPQRWAEYVDRSKQLQGTCSFKSSASLSKTRIAYEGQLKQNDSSKLLVYSSERYSGEPNKTDRVLDAVVMNPLYACRLKRRTPNAAWFVVELIDLRTHSLPSNFEESIEDFRQGNLELVSFGSIPVNIQTGDRGLSQLLQAPGFRVTRCSKSRQAERDLVEVVFETSAEETANGILGGKLLLDPNRFWCLQACEVKTKNTVESVLGVMKYRVLEWGESSDSIPWPKRSVREYEFTLKDGTKGKTDWHYEKDLRVPRPLPADSEFTLTAFGLPEPPGGAWNKTTPWWLYVMVAGVGLLLLGACLGWLRHRKKGLA